jgi:hypothetical protein
VTALFIYETQKAVAEELDFSDSLFELIAENVILLRYVQRDDDTSPTLSILKMRETNHDVSAQAYALGLGSLGLATRSRSDQDATQRGGVDD